jgi:hypothetical protein
MLSLWRHKQQETPASANLLSNKVVVHLGGLRSVMAFTRQIINAQVIVLRYCALIIRHEVQVIWEHLVYRIMQQL